MCMDPEGERSRLSRETPRTCTRVLHFKESCIYMGVWDQWPAAEGRAVVPSLACNSQRRRSPRHPARILTGGGWRGSGHRTKECVDRMVTLPCHRQLGHSALSRILRLAAWAGVRSGGGLLGCFCQTRIAPARHQARLRDQSLCQSVPCGKESGKRNKRGSGWSSRNGAFWPG